MSVHPIIPNAPTDGPKGLPVLLVSVAQALGARTFPGMPYAVFATDGIFLGDARAVLGVIANQIEESWAEFVSDADQVAAMKIADWLREAAHG